MSQGLQHNVPGVSVASKKSKAQPPCSLESDPGLHWALFICKPKDSTNQVLSPAQLRKGTSTLLPPSVSVKSYRTARAGRDFKDHLV